VVSGEDGALIRTVVVNNRMRNEVRIKVESHRRLAVSEKEYTA
jgi:hypothetical protein